MCGIAGHFHSLGQAAPLDLGLIRHRGPDASGEWHSPDGRFWLGNTRLAIIDLSPTGAQPMMDPATGNVIVSNGEIYNHPAVRELLGPDTPWRGTSDTETILLGYGRWGHGVLERLKGMFAFAIYDGGRNELFLARDRLGIKPLYYAVDSDDVRFASEVKMLASGGEAVTGLSIAAYLEWGACPESRLLYPNVQALPAGHAMTIAGDGQVKTWRYWPSRSSFVSPPDNAPSKVRKLIEEAVEEHLLSDVPVASFLSGGIDSSIVTALAAQKLGGKGLDVSEFVTKAGLSKVKLEIVKAEYGAGSTQRDVTGVLQKYAGDLQLISLPATNYNETFGGDPAAGAVKQLKVQYRINGKPSEATFAENALIILPMPK